MLRVFNKIGLLTSVNFSKAKPTQFGLNKPTQFGVNKPTQFGLKPAPPGFKKIPNADPHI